MIVFKEVKDTQFTVRVTQEEKDLWLEAANAQGLTFSEYIRQVMNYEIGKGV